MTIDNRQSSAVAFQCQQLNEMSYWYIIKASVSKLKSHEIVIIYDELLHKVTKHNS
jgi:hypothetical protein